MVVCTEKNKLISFVAIGQAKNDRLMVVFLATNSLVSRCMIALNVIIR